MTVDKIWLAHDIAGEYAAALVPFAQTVSLAGINSPKETLIAGGLPRFFANSTQGYPWSAPK